MSRDLLPSSAAITTECARLRRRHALAAVARRPSVAYHLSHCGQGVQAEALEGRLGHGGERRGDWRRSVETKSITGSARSDSRPAGRRGRPVDLLLSIIYEYEHTRR